MCKTNAHCAYSYCILQPLTVNFVVKYSTVNCEVIATVCTILQDNTSNKVATSVYNHNNQESLSPDGSRIEADITDDAQNANGTYS